MRGSGHGNVYRMMVAKAIVRRLSSKGHSEDEKTHPSSEEKKAGSDHSQSAVLMDCMLCFPGQRCEQSSRMAALRAAPGLVSLALQFQMCPLR